MTTRHALKSDGAWVELRDIDDLRKRDRKKVDALINGAVEIEVDEDGEVTTTPSKGAVLSIMNGVPDVVATLLITAWELPYAPDAQLPSIDPEALDELRLDDHARLMELVDPVVALFMPGRSNNPDDYEKPASPSEPASD
jgi:hypothetical protein